MFNKFMKKGSISLVIREMHIKTPMIHYFTPTMMVIIKTINAEEDLKF